jgi:hypothetical protein
MICDSSDRGSSNLERMSLSIEDEVVHVIVVGLEYIVLFRFISMPSQPKSRGEGLDLPEHGSNKNIS